MTRPDRSAAVPPAFLLRAGRMPALRKSATLILQSLSGRELVRWWEFCGTRDRLPARGIGQRCGWGKKTAPGLRGAVESEIARGGGRIYAPWEGSAFGQLRQTFPFEALAATSIAVRSDPGHKTSIDQCCFPSPSLIAVIRAHNVARPGHIFNPDKNIAAVEKGQAEIKIIRRRAGSAVTGQIVEGCVLPAIGQE